MLSIEQISARVANLRERASERDSRQQDVLAVRQGHIASVYPDFFPEGVDANVVANFIDIVCERPFRGYGAFAVSQLFGSKSG
jgi:hypothetical protein